MREIEEFKRQELRSNELKFITINTIIFFLAISRAFKQTDVTKIGQPFGEISFWCFLIDNDQNKCIFFFKFSVNKTFIKYFVANEI
jgi:hypothetical protein